MAKMILKKKSKNEKDGQNPLQISDSKLDENGDPEFRMQMRKLMFVEDIAQQTRKLTLERQQIQDKPNSKLYSIFKNNFS